MHVHRCKLVWIRVWPKGGFVSTQARGGGGGGGGGGVTQVQKGAARASHISRNKVVFFKTSACPPFCKRLKKGTFLYSGMQYGGGGGGGVPSLLTPCTCSH